MGALDCLPLILSQEPVETRSLALNPVCSPASVLIREACWDSVCTDCVYLTHLLLLARHALYIPRMFMAPSPPGPS